MEHWDVKVQYYEGTVEYFNGTIIIYSGMLWNTVLSEGTFWYLLGTVIL